MTASKIAPGSVFKCRSRFGRKETVMIVLIMVILIILERVLHVQLRMCTAAYGMQAGDEWEKVYNSCWPFTLVYHSLTLKQDSLKAENLVNVHSTCTHDSHVSRTYPICLHTCPGWVFSLLNVLCESCRLLYVYDSLTPEFWN